MAIKTANAAAKVVNLASGIVAEGRDIAGGYFVIDKLSNIPSYADTVGQLCYCLDDSKFHQYDGNDWPEANLGSSGSGGEVTVGNTIAGFTVGDKYLTSNIMKSSMSYSIVGGVYIGTDGILVGHNIASKDGVYYYPGVKIENSTGKLTADNVEITGKVIAESGKIADCVITGKALYNKYTRTIGDKTYNYYMDSVNTISESYGMTDAQSEFVYVGNDGVGTTKFTSLNGGHNDDYLWSYSYMSAGKLVSNDVEITGGKIANFVFDDNALYNKHSYKSGNIDLEYYMTAPNAVNYTYYMRDSESEFSYVGADGIGTMKFTSLDGGQNTNCVVSNSYMSAGKLYSNNAEITGGTISGTIINSSTINSGTIGSTIKISTYGLSDSNSPGGTWGLAPHSTMSGYNSLTVNNTSKEISIDESTSQIMLFTGHSSKNGAMVSTDAKTNTDITNFYVTQSGLVKAKNILCYGDNSLLCSISSSGNGNTYMNPYQFAVTNKIGNVSASLDSYSVTWRYNGNTVGSITQMQNSNYIKFNGDWRVGTNTSDRLCIPLTSGLVPDKAIVELRGSDASGTVIADVAKVLDSLLTQIFNLNNK